MDGTLSLNLTLVYWVLKIVVAPGCIWEVEEEVGLYPHYCQRQGQATAGSFPAWEPPFRQAACQRHCWQLLRFLRGNFLE